jgi:PmbA protein
VRDIIGKALAKGASRSEVFELKSLSTEVSYEANKLKGVSRTEEHGVALRVVKDGRIGFSTSTKLTEPDKIVEDALVTAEFGDRAAFDFAGEKQMSEVPTSDQKVAQLCIDDMM